MDILSYIFEIYVHQKYTKFESNTHNYCLKTYFLYYLHLSMIRRMCGVKLNERKKSEELRELLVLEPVMQFDDEKEWVEMVWTC